MLRWLLLVLALLSVWGKSNAQTPRLDTLVRNEGQILWLIVKNSDAQTVKNLVRKGIKWKNDTLLQTTDPANIVKSLQSKGHLTASLDTLQGGDTLRQLYLGPAYQWVQFRPADAVAMRWLAATRLDRQLVAGKPLRPEILVRAQERMLAEGENHGYPFARIWLDSLQLDSAGHAQAVLRVLPGPQFTFAALRTNGEVRLPKSFLARYLGIREGEAYSRAQVLAIKPYLEQYASPTVKFAGGQATINLWLKKKRAGRFDFIVGLLPQPNADNTSTSLLLTGSLNALLLNSLGQGERIAVELERLRPETQKLDLQVGFPYIAGTPFGAEGRLSIFRRDSTWIDAQGSVGASYLLPRANKVSFFVENRSSFLQRIDSVRIVGSKQLPANLDFRQNGLGIELDMANLDYRFNPRKGYWVHLRLLAARHTIERNAEIEQLTDPSDKTFRFSALYDSLQLRTYRIRPDVRLEYFVPFAGRFTFLLRLRGGGIFSTTPVAQNEQYRLGGNKLLRGFDEESLFATRWAVATSEARLIIGPNSHIAVFADGGYIENITARTRVFQRPLGLGAGINFETGAGVFGISAAVGRPNPGDGLDLRAAKIHIGFVSLF
jgi:outer membrane protein assembly factor BamA